MCLSPFKRVVGHKRLVVVEYSVDIVSGQLILILHLCLARFGFGRPLANTLCGVGNSLFAVCGGGHDGFHAFLDGVPDLVPLETLVSAHSHAVEEVLSLGLHLTDSLHRKQRLSHRLSVIAHWSVASLLEFKRRIHSHFLPSHLSRSLGPFRLSWVPLLVKVAMAFGSTELKLLYFKGKEWTVWKYRNEFM